MISTKVQCKLKVEPHTIDKCIDLGISDEELSDGITKGAIRKSIVFNSNKSKHFIRYKYYEIVCICLPCRREIETIYIPR